MTLDNPLTDSERAILINKVIPSLFVGSVIWLVSELIFASIFTKIAFSSEFFVTTYILMNILNFILFLLFYYSSKKGNTKIGLTLYFFFAITAGIIAVPISMTTIFDYNLKNYVHAFVSLVFAGNLIIFILGLIFKGRILKGGYFWIQLIIFGISTTIIMITFIIIYSITNIFLIIISVFFLMISSLIVMMIGIKLTKKVKEDYWIYVVFRAMCGLLIFSFLVMLVVIIIIAVIISEGDLDPGDLDIGDFVTGGSVSGGKGSGKKKKSYLKDLTLN